MSGPATADAMLRISTPGLTDDDYASPFIGRTAGDLAHGGSRRGRTRRSRSSTFTATDNSGGSGVDYTEYYSSAARSWTQGTSVTISTPGTTTVKYRSTDNAGNVEAAKKLHREDWTPASPFDRVR